MNTSTAEAFFDSNGQTVPLRTGQTQQIPLDQIARQAAAKLNAIEIELNNELVERKEVIRDIMRALIISEHVLLTGEPGTGKSYLARCLVSHITKARSFEWLLNRTTDPSALLGPYKIKEMEKGRFTRNWTGLLPDAHVVFLDEIYKSNDPTLNILLAIVNERIFHDDGQKQSVPLKMLIAASNEGPEDDSLLALHDRLAFRHNVKKVKDPSNKAKMWQQFIARRKSGDKYQPKTTITLEEINVLEEFARQVHISNSVLSAMLKLDNIMEQQGMKLSDRRSNMRFKIIQGEAALNGRGKANLQDLSALTYVLAEKDEDIKFIKDILDKLIDPYESEFKELLERVKEIHKTTMKTKSFADKAKAAVEAKAAITKIKEKMETLRNEMKDAGMNTTKVVRGISETDKLVIELMNECLGISQESSSGDMEVNDNMEVLGLDGDDGIEMPF